MPSEHPISIDSPILRRLLVDWQFRRDERTFPSRKDFDPVDLAYALGKLLLIEVLYEPLRFRYRLIGSELVQRAGIDLTGKMVDEFPEPEYREFALRQYAAAVDLRCPISTRHNRLVLDN